MRRKKLVIISHTEHYERNGEIVGWGPTVNEINYLADFWDEVLHVACLYKGNAPKSSKPYDKKNIKFVALPPTGGKKIWNKLDILWNIPFTLRKVSKSIDEATEVQFRAPTGIGVYLLPAFSFLFRRKFTFWVKYAGNWAQENPPKGYQFQRWWLKKNLANCKVTINGFWEQQPPHCYSLENPCLTQNVVSHGKSIQNKKLFDLPFRLTFVGRLEDEKGVSRIIESLKIVDTDLIERIDFVGDGESKEDYEKQISFLKDKAFFHGYLDSSEVHKILAKSHFFLLPSDSEGFPKVIAEAGCYGSIPVVSNVGSIGHYINDEINGFLWDAKGVEAFSSILEKALSTPTEILMQKSKNILQIAEKFTFDNYQSKLESNVLV